MSASHSSSGLWGGLRIAYFANFAPAKLGTGEDRLMALGRSCAARGHKLTLYCHNPVHSVVDAALRDSGVERADLSQLSRGSLPGVARRLAQAHDVILLNNIAPRARAALAAYAAWPARVLFVDHVSGPPLGADSGSTLPGRLLDRFTMVRVHEVAGVSEYVRARVQTRFHLRSERTRVLYGGVDTSRFRPPEVPRPPVPLRLSTVAALIPEKGVDVLLRACTKLGELDWTLQVVGTGAQEENLKRLAATLGISGRVEFLGLRDDVDAILRDTHVFVHPAVWQEALGYTVLEAMASACAVVASRVGAIPELIRHEHEGLLAEAGRAEAIADAVGRLARDPALRKRLGAAARARVEREFDLRRTVSNILDWCEEAAGGRRRDDG